MELLKTIVSWLARFFLSLVFLVSGINQILYWKETEKKFLSVISDWQTYTVQSEFFQSLFQVFANWSPLFLVVITSLQLIGALLLLLGRNEKLGALFLILALIPTTLLVQHFWFSEAHVRAMQLSFFLRDLALLGGLLIVMIRGTKNEDPFS